MRNVMIRYKVKPDHLARHLELLRDVYEELESVQPDGLRYATFQLEDEVSFVDLVAGPDLPRPLPELQAFQRYRADLDERCDEPPEMTDLHQVHSFRTGEEREP